MNQIKAILESMKILSDEEGLALLPDTLYHATLKVFEQSIDSKGLIAGGAGTAIYGWNTEPLIFMSTNRSHACHFVDVALEYADDPEQIKQLKKLYRQSNKTGVVYEINVSHLDKSKLRLDPNFPQYAEDYSLSFVYAGNIPTSAFVKKSEFPLDGRYTGY